MKKIFQKYFVEKTNNSRIQFLRYVFVGAAAFLTDFSLLFILTEFARLNYLISAAISFVIGLVVNYILSILWIFTQRIYSKRWLEFIIFGIIGIVGLGFNEIFLLLFTQIFGIYYLGSKIISTVFVYFWNFIARKLLLFK